LIVSDITERKRAEEELKRHREHLEELVEERTKHLEEKSQELSELNVLLQEASHHKSEFLSNVSHELRTPLTSIIGYTKLILDGVEGEIKEEQRKDLAIVYSSSQHLLQLMNDLLDISKLEAGRVELCWQEFSVSDLLAEAVPPIQRLAEEKGLTLAYDVGAGHNELYADKDKVRQVLLNILWNAVKFTDEGGIDLKVSESDTDFTFSVTDTGIGIREDDLERIFDSFQQVGPAQIAGYEGTGLGLAISKQFVEMHGGLIWANSELGKGSTFTFTIPKKKGAD
jgi:signal transduction histidine kinase